MRAVVILFLLAMLTSGCAHRVPRDQSLSALLVGRWFNDDPIDATLTAHYEKEYFSDGTAAGFFDVYKRKNDGSRGDLMARITFTSKWRVEGTEIVIWDMKSTPQEYLDPAQVDRDTVLSIDRIRIKYRTEKGELGEDERMKKEPNQSLEPTRMDDGSAI